METLPTISVVVPNYNGGATLARTLESLLDQGYPGLQVVVVDGGSTDDSVDVIKRFAPRLDHWESEKDRGQSHAINKGFARCTGDVVNWLCSDDYLLPGALATVGRRFAEWPDADVVYGGCVMDIVREGTQWVAPAPPAASVELLPAHNPILQPACFYRRRLLAGRTPVLDETNHYAMDFELWNYFRRRGAVWRATDEVLAVYPHSGENKGSTGGDKILRDHERIYRAYAGPERVPLTFWYRLLRLPVVRFRKRHPGRAAQLAGRALERAYRTALGAFYDRRYVNAMDWSPWA
jgi:glycosyltransferase involved in cell wall biosynthesis